MTRPVVAPVGRRLSGLPLRTRLVAGFAAAMLVLLTAAGAFVYWRVEYALDRGLDDDLGRAADTIAGQVGPGGTVPDHTAADATGVRWQVVDASGAVLDHGAGAPDTPMVSASVLRGSGTQVVDVGRLLPASATPYRIRVEPVPVGAAPASGPPARLVVAVRRDHRDEALRELLLQLTLAGLGALAVASVVGDLLARAALRPVERYRRRAAEIAGGASGLRLEVPRARDDEVTRLGHTLNAMLAELESALAAERRFVDDASHELRTPLTVLSSRLQLARRRRRTVAEHEAVLDELMVDLARLEELTTQLLDLGATAATGGRADAAAVVPALLERRLAAGGGSVSAELEPGPLVVPVPVLALERILTNLLDNAARHGRPPIAVRLGARGGWVVLEVVDSGEGLSGEDLGRARERFARSAPARARPGSGLGLAIVDELVTAAGGELRLCSAGIHDGAGALAPEVPCRHDDRMTVTVVLPRVVG